MRLAFMGTPEFAVPALAELIAAGHDVAAVYSRPPQPKGRGHALSPSPVHVFAEANGLSVRTPRNFKSAEETEAFRLLALDAAVVVAYGVILPKAALEAPRLGCFNLHASLLPRWRGAAPIQRAIMACDSKTGVQVMRMEPGLDTGPVVLSETVEIAADDTAGTLAPKLARIGAALLPRALAAIERGGAVETPQAEEGVTYAAKISSAETRIDWTRTGREVDCHIRGLSPTPGAWFEAGNGERIKTLLSRAAGGRGRAGEVLEAGARLVVACGAGAVELLRLQRAGRAAQDAVEFLRGFPLLKGAQL
jgi:methionyl-tRNA formyltransferase